VGGDTIRVDLEHSVLLFPTQGSYPPLNPLDSQVSRLFFTTVPSLPAAAVLGGPSSFSPTSPPQRAQTFDSAIVKSSLQVSNVSLSCYVYLLHPQDDGSGNPIDQVMSDLHRKDTGPLDQAQYGDPSANIWGLYLSIAKTFDKERVDSWSARTDGVLEFVRVHPRRFSNRGCKVADTRNGHPLYKLDTPSPCCLKFSPTSPKFANVSSEN